MTRIDQCSHIWTGPADDTFTESIGVPCTLARDHEGALHMGEHPTHGSVMWIGGLHEPLMNLNGKIIQRQYPANQHG